MYAYQYTQHVTSILKLLHQYVSYFGNLREKKLSKHTVLHVCIKVDPFISIDYFCN